MQPVGDKSAQFDGLTDPDSPEPLWVQVKRAVMESIASGALPPGSRLPAERELCRELGVSRVTLRKGLGALVDEGILSASHGRGWYVVPAGPAPNAAEWPSYLESFTETARRLELAPSSRVLRREVGEADLDEAETLLIAPGTRLLILDRIRLLEGVTIALDQARVPLTHVPEIVDVDFANASLFAELERAGAGPYRAEATIEAQPSDAGLAELLGIEPGKPTLVLDQLVYDRSGRPLMMSTVRYCGERYRLRTSFVR